MAGSITVIQLCMCSVPVSVRCFILWFKCAVNAQEKMCSDRVIGLLLAYTMAKYGMSMCVLGMAEEFKDDGIAVNALWPKTGRKLHLLAYNLCTCIILINFSCLRCGGQFNLQFNLMSFFHGLQA